MISYLLKSGNEKLVLHISLEMSFIRSFKDNVINAELSNTDEFIENNKSFYYRIKKFISKLNKQNVEFVYGVGHNESLGYVLNGEEVYLIEIGPNYSWEVNKLDSKVSVFDNDNRSKYRINWNYDGATTLVKKIDKDLFTKMMLVHLMYLSSLTLEEFVYEGDENND